MKELRFVYNNCNCPGGKQNYDSVKTLSLFFNRLIIVTHYTRNLHIHQKRLCRVSLMNNQHISLLKTVTTQKVKYDTKIILKSKHFLKKSVSPLRGYNNGGTLTYRLRSGPRLCCSGEILEVFLAHREATDYAVGYDCVVPNRARYRQKPLFFEKHIEWFLIRQQKKPQYPFTDIGAFTS